MARTFQVRVFTNRLVSSSTPTNDLIGMILAIFLIVVLHLLGVSLHFIAKVQLFRHLFYRREFSLACITKMDEDTLLYNSMKDLPDFDCFPIPSHWFSKFGIPPRNPVSVREYIDSGYTFKMSIAPKDLPPLIISEPQQGGKLVEMIIEEPVKVEVISRPLELKDGEAFPAVLPSLRLTDHELHELSHRQAETVSEQVEPGDACIAPPQDETSSEQAQ